MGLIAAFVYWVIVALWLAVLATVCVEYWHNPRTFGTTRLLLVVLGIDTFRNIFENVYFGFFFGARLGVFPPAIGDVLGRAHLLIIPKLINLGAAAVVLGLLLLRWLPTALRERAAAESEVLQKGIALAQEIEEQRCLFEVSADLILVTDRDGVIRRISDSCAAILGYAPEEIIGRRDTDLACSGELNAFDRHVERSVRGDGAQHLHAKCVHKDGHTVTLALTSVWSEQAQRFFVIGRDMTEQKAAQERLHHLAHFDQLTGLPNRSSLLLELNRLLGPASGSSLTTIAMFDLDGFKKINDTLGHSTGDRLLEQVAQRLRELAAETGSTYRLGGDEFVLVLPDCGDPLVIAGAVESVLERIGEPVEVDGRQLFVSASAGIAIGPVEGSDADDLLANADLALYAAKAAGGRRRELYVPSMRAKAQALRQLETELGNAYANNEFVLHFQPQVRLSDGAVVGAEALLRWQHPERGLLSPGAFIDALAQSPVALEVGRWILRTACTTAMSWRLLDLPPVRVGVNLFPAQFREGCLLADVDAALREAGLPSEALELEITENTVLNDEEGVLPMLDALRTRGVGLAFDDFGTGYASLRHVRRFPLTRIKIDRSFIQAVGEGPAAQDAAIVRSIIMMARNLGLAVTAEGVETPAQAKFLRSVGCEEAQGFLFGRPVRPRDIETLLRRRAESRDHQLAWHEGWGGLRPSAEVKPG